jgi:hypothetical protein
MPVNFEKCQNVNLLNHMKQKNIPFEVEQYTYLSPQDIETETQRGNIQEVEVNFMNQKDFIYYARFEDEGMTSGYYYVPQLKFAHRPMWRTKLTFNGDTVYGLGYTKKESLRNTVNMISNKITQYFQ